MLLLWEKSPLSLSLSLIIPSLFPLIYHNFSPSPAWRHSLETTKTTRRDERLTMTMNLRPSHSLSFQPLQRSFIMKKKLNCLPCSSERDDHLDPFSRHFDLILTPKKGRANWAYNNRFRSFLRPPLSRWLDSLLSKIRLLRSPLSVHINGLENCPKPFKPAVRSPCHFLSKWNFFISYFEAGKKWKIVPPANYHVQKGVNQLW